eukprot:3569681-Amphidinium_carterae.2
MAITVQCDFICTPGAYTVHCQHKRIKMPDFGSKILFAVSGMVPTVRNWIQFESENPPSQ